MKNYNGWKNWETWNCNLWLNNDEGSYQLLKVAVDPDHLKEIWVEYFEKQDDIETSEIDFKEIFKASRGE